MNGTSYGGAPGYGVTSTQTFPEVLASLELQAHFPGGVLLAQGWGVVNKGRVLGKITATGKYAPYTSTTLNGAAALNAVSLTFADASAFVIGDNILVGTDATLHAITAINGNVVTIAATGLTSAQSNGVSVTTNDGRSTAVCVLDNSQDTTTADVGASAWIAGLFVKANCFGVDANAQTTLNLCKFF